MILSGHVLMGAAIGVALDEPKLAIPAALLSHYALDAIPHQDYRIVHLKSGGGLLFVRDLAKVFCDLAFGIAVVALLTEGAILPLMYGLAAAFPDATTFLVYLLNRRIPSPTHSNRTFFSDAKRLLDIHYTVHQHIQSSGIKHVPWPVALVVQITTIVLGAFTLSALV